MQMHAGREITREQQYPNAYLAHELESNRRNGDSISEVKEERIRIVPKAGSRIILTHIRPHRCSRQWRSTTTNTTLLMSKVIRRRNERRWITSCGWCGGDGERQVRINGAGEGGDLIIETEIRVYIGGGSLSDDVLVKILIRVLLMILELMVSTALEVAFRGAMNNSSLIR